MIGQTTRVRRAGPFGQSGIALALVMIAVAVAAILCLTFLTTQSTAVQISKNIGQRTRARMIAESGLEMAIAYVAATPGWRDQKSEGTWTQDEPFAGGHFTVAGRDGTYEDGAVVGDGDLGDEPTDPLALMAAGSYGGAVHVVRAVLEFAPGQARHIQLSGSWLRVADGGLIDSFDSALGAYDEGGNVDSAATVTTNSTQTNSVVIEGGGVICGDVFVGPGADPNDVINDPGGVTGTVGAAHEAFTMLTIEEPTGLGPSQGDKEVTSGTLDATMHVDNLTVKTGSVWVDGETTILVEGDFTLEDGGKIKLSAGATLDLYVKGKCTIHDKGKVNTDAADPTRVRIYLLGNSDMIVEGNATKVYATITGPDTKLVVEAKGEVLGTFIGSELEVLDKGKFHQDTRESYVGGTVGEPYAPCQIRWCEQP